MPSRNLFGFELSEIASSAFSGTNNMTLGKKESFIHVPRDALIILMLKWY